MTQDHEHSWSPVPMSVGKYECSCGTTARRVGRDIVPYKTAYRSARFTARGAGPAGPGRKGGAL